MNSCITNILVISSIMLKGGLYIFSLILFSCLTSCKINQLKHGLRTGLWISKTDAGELIYRSRGRYSKGREKGTWKYFQNDTVYQKDKYSGNNAKVTLYHPNKKVRARGQTRLDLTAKQLHWYYTGDWKYYDPKGKLVKVVTYKEVNSIAETSPNEQ
jgi:antitoxin component YwqK of YwqJK toxin-antitoxin module